MVEERESGTLERATVVIAIILGASALFVANDFFIPVALSLLLSSLLWPVVQQLQRWRIPSGVGAAICILGTVGIFVAAVTSFEPPVRKFANDIPKSIAAARPRLSELSSSFSKILGSPSRRTTPATPTPAAGTKKPTSASSNATATDTTARSAKDSNATSSADSTKIDSAAKEKTDSTAKQGADSTTKPKSKAATDKPINASSNFDLSTISGGAPATLSKALGIASSLLGDFVEIMLLAMFILAAGSAWEARLAKSVSSDDVRRKVIDAVSEMRAVVSRYVFTITLINVVQGIVVGLALKLLGYPSPMLWAVLTFALEFIPYLGGFVMVGLLLVAGLAASRDFPSALYGPAAYLLVTTTQNSVLGPILYGRTLRLNPVAILAGLMLWYMLWGVAGAFLSVPILAAFNVLAGRLPSLKGAHEFLSD